MKGLLDSGYDDRHHTHHQSVDRNGLFATDYPANSLVLEA
jgi:hypothetical protein